MKTLETSSLDKVLIELRKISDQLKKMEKNSKVSNGYDIMKDFYRDSFDFMVDQNIETFELLKSVIDGKDNRVIKNVA
jgi:predicted glycosyltransferase